MTAANITVSETPLVLYTLRRADDALIEAAQEEPWVIEQYEAAQG